MTKQAKRGNGVTLDAERKMLQWQHLLNQGWSITQIAEFSALGRKDTCTAEHYYMNRLADLIEQGKLKA